MPGVLEHRIADQALPRMRRLILAAIRAARQVVRLDTLTLAWEHGAEHVLRAIPFDAIRTRLWGDFHLILRDTLERSAVLLQERIDVQKDTLGTLGFRFDLTNPRVFEWIERHAANLVVGIDEESKRAIRTVLERMFRDGIPPRTAAREIRDLIGLTERQITAVENYRLTLGESDRVGQLTAEYSERLLRQRAENIARTESMTASNQGQHELWRQARDQGFIEPEQKRKWIITPDERLCEICAPVPDNGPVGLDEPFVLGDGSIVMNPPGHPQCRCTTALAFSALA